MKSFEVSDLALHRKIIDLQGVAGHPHVYGTVRSVVAEKNAYQTQIWRFSADGTPAIPLTQGTADDESPRLSPDKRTIAFMSTRAGGTPQLYLLSLEGGEARQLGYFKDGVTSHRWAQDGRTLFVSAPLPVDPDMRGARGPAPGEASDGDPEVCWKLPYKMDGMGYLLKREVHLFSVDVESGDARQITDGAFEVMGFEPSPDGREIAYVRTRSGRYAHRTDLWLCAADGSAHRQITHGLATVMQPAWAPSGKQLAFAGAAREGDSETRLWNVRPGLSQVTQVGADNLEVADALNLLWSTDEQSLTLMNARRGRHEIARIDMVTGAVTTLIGGDRQFSAFCAVADGWAISVETPVSAHEVHVTARNGGNEQIVSRLNAWWQDRPTLRMDCRRFEVPNGRGGTETIEGWLIRAADAPDGVPQPLLSDVHGGPASYALLDYDTNVYWQALCARGWSVLLLHAVGSGSFGTNFCSRLSGHWGELDLPQHLEAIRQLQNDKVCDERVAVVGKSYGGYLTAWAVGHSDVFRAAVVMAPVGNIETHYGTSDGGYYADPLYIGTAPYFDRSRARALSPLQSIEQSKTPTLFLQGKDDERCPKCQSEEMFVSLYRAGETPTELVLYPGEGHLFLGEGKPKCREDAAARIMDWIEQHTSAFNSQEDPKP